MRLFIDHQLIRSVGTVRPAFCILCIRARIKGIARLSNWRRRTAGANLQYDPNPWPGQALWKQALTALPQCYDTHK